MTMIPQNPPHTIDEQLKAHIQTFGALPVRHFQDILLYSKNGYYANQHVIGRQGDFITAPEISQVFGEILALYYIDYWQRIGKPDHVTFVELGGGRGTLMADMVRIFSHFPDFIRALSLHIVDISPILRHQQITKIAAPITHHASLETVPESDTTFIIANEFFDALPVEQWIVNQDGKRPRLIDVNDTWYYIPHGINEYIIETSEMSLNIAREIKRRLMHGGSTHKSTGGMALIIDYGDAVAARDIRKGDTLQAVYAHQKVSVFDHMGQADLSHHVDFKILIDVFTPLSTTLTPQGTFLTTHGIMERTEYLASKAPDQAATLRTGTARLISESAMGALFKVLCVETVGK
jgi:NADH dehydrogenase [ubiquinone] 1 alpha subcomplex assembly factor 7